MDIEILPGSLQGRITAPTSKSSAHRAAICAALAQGGSTLEPLAGSKDIEVTLEAAKALGARVEGQGARLTITGVGTPPPSAEIDCCESGSTLRFFVPIAAALGINARFFGQGQLPTRPMSPLLDALRAHGVTVVSSQQEIPSVSGRLQSGRYSISGSVSSQYITGLLFALPLLEGDSTIHLTSSLESRGYVDMTVQMMGRFGVTVYPLDDGWRIPGGQRYQARDCALEGDYSGGAFWLCAGALGSDVEVSGLEADSLQGDKQIVSILQSFGARIDQEDRSVRARPNRLVSLDVDVRDIPDLVPVLAVTAALANGTTTLYNAARLRLKESDRLQTVTHGLKALGAGIVEYTDKLVIIGQESLRGGEVDSFGDHRIAMAMSIAALRCQQPVIVRGAECVEKSYQDFYSHFAQLGGTCRVI